MQLIIIKLVPPTLVNNDSNIWAIGTILTETSVPVTQKNLQEGKTGKNINRCILSETREDLYFINYRYIVDKRNQLNCCLSFNHGAITIY